MSTNLRWLIALVFILKCLLGFYFPLVADEAYYYVWSLFPQLSYFDHPGMVSWLISLGDQVLPSHNPLAVRLPFIILSTLTLAVWLRILKANGTSNSTLILFLVLFCFNPLLGAGSILATPDVPLLFFWTLSYFFFQALVREQKLRWYALLGLSLGLGFCSKYHIVVFVLCGFVYLIWTKKIRALRLSGIFLTLVLGMISCLPVLIWNYQNEWSSFLFQLNHGFGRSYYRFEWSVGYLIGQFLIASPLVFIELFRRKNLDSMHKAFSWSQLIFFFTSTFKSVVEANWPLAAHPHALAHFAGIANRKKIYWTISYWTAIYIALISMLMVPKTRALLKNQWTSSDLVEVASKVKSYKPLYGPTYQVSSLITWINQSLTPKLRGVSRKDFFDELPISEPNKGTFYFLKEIDAGLPERFSRAKTTKLDSFDNLDLELYQVIYD